MKNIHQKSIYKTFRRDDRKNCVWSKNRISAFIAEIALGFKGTETRRFRVSI